MATTESVTIRDLAREANVSPATVSLALRGSSKISDSCTKKVREVARRMNYRPRLAAQLMRSKRSGRIGLVLPPTASNRSQAVMGFESPVLRDFVAACSRENIGYHIEFFAGSAPTPDQIDPPKDLLNGLVDGVVLAGFVDENLRAWLAGQDEYPWVSLGDLAEHAVMDATDLGFYAAVQHLAALGHRKIAFACGNQKYAVHRLARAGFDRAVEEFALGSWCGEHTLSTEPPLGQRSAERAAIFQWARALLDGDDRPTAVVCTSSLTARTLVALALERGLRIPDDLSIIAHGPAEMMEHGYPEISAIEPDYEQMVAISLSMMKRLIAGKSVDKPNVRVTPWTVMRDTVARPPEEMHKINGKLESSNP